MINREQSQEEMRYILCFFPSFGINILPSRCKKKLCLLKLEFSACISHGYLAVCDPTPHWTRLSCYANKRQSRKVNPRDELPLIKHQWHFFPQASNEVAFGFNRDLEVC